ncbi:MAG: 3-dehydroquinate synthase [Desulfuromonadales bacterium]
MLERIEVGLSERSYPIWIGSDILSRLGTALKEARFPRKIGIITNPTVSRLYLEQLEEALEREGFESHCFEILDGEEYKTLATLEEIYDFLIAKDFGRVSGLLALGGGVVGDITGFAAATYLRGIPFAQVPTTLLSQVDSSVGGKTAVNHRLGKNLVGAFYQPAHVHIDVKTLSTLNQREFSSGMAEVVKYGIISDRSFFDWLEINASLLETRDRAILVEAVKRSCQIKANIVEIDEKETSLRATLNFGHTFGHAVETLSGYGLIKHGEAVGIGMIVAAAIALELGLCEEADLDRIRALLMRFALPVAPPPFTIEEYLEVMGRDKKVQDGMPRLVLNRGIGDCEIRKVAHPEKLFSSVLDRLTG